MSAKVFTKQELENISVISLPKAYQRADQIPLDPSTIFASYDDAVEYASGESNYGDISYAGQILSVINQTEQTIDVYKIDYDGSLVKIGEGESKSLSAQTYSDAVLMATSDNIGSIINVTNSETISGDTYSAGLYVVTGAGAVSKLGVTSATGDVEGDVENLKSRVVALETAVTDLSESCYWIDGDNE